MCWRGSFYFFFFFLMIRRPPRSTRTEHSFPTRRSSDLAVLVVEEEIDAALRLAAEIDVRQPDAVSHVLDHSMFLFLLGVCLRSYCRATRRSPLGVSARSTRPTTPRTPSASSAGGAHDALSKRSSAGTESVTT